MIVTVLRNAGNPDAPQGATVDASGWGNLDLMLQMGYVRPATAAEHTAYQEAIAAAVVEPPVQTEPLDPALLGVAATEAELATFQALSAPPPTDSEPSGEPEPAVQTEPTDPEPSGEPEPIVQTESTDPELSGEPEPSATEPTKPTVRKSR